MISLDKTDRFPLIFRPTPLHPLRSFSKVLGGPEIWVKREDCTGLAGGGNKARKLEYYVADALKQGADTLVTVGGLQSNHTRQTAAAAAVAGMGCVLVQRQWGAGGNSEYEQVGNNLLTKILGAERRLIPGMGRVLPDDCDLQAVLADLEAAGHTPYFIPAGASDHHLGGLGFVDCLRETLSQADALGVTFDAILHATSSGSTQAGLLAGLHMMGRNTRVIGICVNEQPQTTRDVVCRIANATSERLGSEPFLHDDKIDIRTDFVGEGYGLPSAATIEAIRTLATCEGVLVDPVYEGKAVEGLMALVRGGEFAKTDRVLWIHLGGAQALHAYHSYF